jgi:hypothetical protein
MADKNSDSTDRPTSSDLDLLEKDGSVTERMNQIRREVHEILTYRNWEQVKPSKTSVH